MDVKSLLLVVICACITNVLNAQHQVFNTGRILLQPFAYNEVKHLDGPLKRQFDEVAADYLAIPDDELLKGFRERAGLPTNGAADMGGWYSIDLFHVFGQFISGMSRLYAVSGNEAMKVKVNALVREWAKTIEKDGYFFYSRKPNAPHYVYEKMIGGLVDNYIFAGNGDALKHLSVITDWAIEKLTRERIYGQTQSEWYTLPENLYRAYAITKDRKYLDFGKVWEYHDYWNVHARGEKVNTGIRHHAYSHLNTLSSAAAAYMISGDEKYKDIIKNGYEYMQREQCFATGGYGPNERFLAKEDLITVLQNTHNSFEEQCGSWAIFKLSKYLMEVTGDARYGDWIEKMIINGVGANIPMTKDGKVHYYADYNPRQGTKYNYHLSWSCCTGTRPQAVAEYADLIYFKSRDAMYVNLYTPSSVEWSGLAITQQTRFPEHNETELLIAINGSGTVQGMINFRRPLWAREAPIVLVNGRMVKTVLVKNWMQLQRAWKNGDKVKIVFPMQLHLDRLDETKPFPAAIMYGPVAMASNVIPDYPTDFVNERDLPTSLTVIENQPLHFQVRNHDELMFRPYYQYKTDEPYVLYFDPAVQNVVPNKYWALTGKWQRAKGPYFTGDKEGSVSIDFTGRGVVIYFSSFPNSGIAKVEIDGKEVEKVNTYNPKPGETPLTKTYAGFTQGKHTLKVSVTGEKDPQSRSTFLNISKFEVVK